MQEQLAQLPDVRSAAASVIALMTDSEWSSTIKVEGYKPKEGEDMNPRRQRRRPRLLRDHRTAAAGGPRVHDQGRRRRAAGRDHQRDDGGVLLRQGEPARPPHRLGPRQDHGHRDRRRRARLEDVDAAGTESKRFVYTPYTQEPEIGQITFYLRARGNAAAIGASVRQVARRVDSEPADLRHEDDERGGGRVAVPRADGRGAVGGVRRRWRRCSRRSASTA